MELADFTDQHSRLLQYALAAFLEVSPEVVQIEKVEEGSVKVTVALPFPLAERIVTSYRDKDEELLAYLETLPIARVQWVVYRELAKLLEGLLSLPAEIIERKGDIDFPLAPSVGKQLAQRLEEYFGIHLEPDTLKTLEDVLKLSYLIQEKAENDKLFTETLNQLAKLGETELQELLGVEENDHKPS